MLFVKIMPKNHETSEGVTDDGLKWVDIRVARIKRS